MRNLVLATVLGAVVACGPSRNQEKACDTAADCSAGSCTPGDIRACYTGASGTKGVGACTGGEQTCTDAGQWGDCQGEVVPRGEVCGNGKDEDCDGKVDENTDLDGDGWTTCDGDCCDSNECDNPAMVNPGAYEIAGDGVDNDCDGAVDNAVPICDASAM
ncbi:MAG: MopE-related protein, partial [Acidobacteriota bacterium]